MITNTEDRETIDEWDGEEYDYGHQITVVIKPEFEETVRQSPDVDKDAIITPDEDDEDSEIDGLWMRESCPWFWCEVERESLEEWVAEQLGLKVEWIEGVCVDG